MQCPRCQSTRIQRGYDDAPMLFRLGGRRELLCNNCGLEFQSFGWSAKFKRVPGKRDESNPSRRRAPRYRAHLPATIRLVDVGANNEPSFSLSVRGHCQTISSLGMALSFVGSRFDPAEFAQVGRLLLVVISLPGSAIEALVKTITHDRIENSDGPANWFVGTSIVQISEADRSQLLNYLDRRSRE
jgi:hypothetical protein